LFKNLGLFSNRDEEAAWPSGRWIIIIIIIKFINMQLENVFQRFDALPSAVLKIENKIGSSAALLRQ